MAHTDTIADLLTRLRNAVRARHRYIDFRLSKMKLEVVKLLEKQGFIEHMLVNNEQRKVRVFLKYDIDREPVLQGLKRHSSPGLRKYVTSERIPRVNGGLGIAVVSTSQGLMDGETARKAKIGGELICLVW